MSNLVKVGITSCAHLNQENSPSEEVTLERRNLKGGYPFIPCLRLFIPENLDLDQLLNDVPPDFIYKKDRFIYILSLIYSIPSKKKKSIQNYQGYTPVSKKILGATIRDYRAYIDYLKTNCIVEESNYIVGKRSRGLRFFPSYRRKVKAVEITDWPLIKNIVHLRKNYRVDKTGELIYLKKWLSEGLEVDLEGGKQYLHEEYIKDLTNSDVNHPLLRYNSRLIPFESLSCPENPLFFVDNTAGRLHTNVTQLKSELRKFINFKGKTLVSVDLVNSQLYLALSLLSKEAFDKNNIAGRIVNIREKLEGDDINSILIMLSVLIESHENEEDILLFKKLSSNGTFYEEFSNLLLNDEADLAIDITNRKEIKSLVFSTIFSKNTSEKYLKSIRIFKRFFPSVYKIFKNIKEGYHPTLAILLQNLEADLILHQACKTISEEKPDVFIMTLHDSIITTEDNVEYVKEIMSKVLHENIGLLPTLKEERWE